MSISTAGQFDLGTGYPNLTVPSWILQIYADSHASVSASLSLLGGLGAARPYSTDALVEGVRVTLGLQAHDVSILSTLSGGVALSIACQALVSGKRIGAVVYPTIDLLPAALAAAGASIFSFSRNTGSDAASILDDLTNSSLPTESVIAFCSPDNPTGLTCSEEQLTALGALALSRGWSVLVDQCNLLLGPEQTSAPLAANFFPSELPFVVTWDTGKMFGLRHEKLGFLLSSPATTPAVKAALSIVQFCVSDHAVILFTEILKDSNFPAYLSVLRTDLAKNRSTLKRLEEFGLEQWKTPAGSFELLSIVDRRLGSASDLTRRLLLEADVGVVNAQVFFPPQNRNADLDRNIRIALARDPELFNYALDRIIASLRTSIRTSDPI
jgi:aspartate/methionine/tyrosine aminotransferase